MFDTTAVGTRGDGMPILQLIFEQPAKVRRVRMLSHEPLYKVGLSFLDLDPQMEQKIAALRPLTPHRTTERVATRRRADE